MSKPCVEGEEDNDSDMDLEIDYINYNNKTTSTTSGDVEPNKHKEGQIENDNNVDWSDDNEVGSDWGSSSELVDPNDLQIHDNFDDKKYGFNMNDILINNKPNPNGEGIKLKHTSNIEDCKIPPNRRMWVCSRCQTHNC